MKSTFHTFLLLAALVFPLGLVFRASFSSSEPTAEDQERTAPDAARLSKSLALRLGLQELLGAQEGTLAESLKALEGDTEGSEAHEDALAFLKDSLSMLGDLDDVSGLTEHVESLNADGVGGEASMQELLEAMKSIRNGDQTPDSMLPLVEQLMQQK